MVASSDEDFALVEGLIETFDTPAEARDLKFRVIHLEHARVSEIGTIVEDLADEMQWVNQWGGGASETPDKIMLRSKARTNSFVLLGQGESFDMVESMIRAMDVPRGSSAEMAVRVFKIEQADLNVVRQALEQAFSDPGNRRRWWEPPNPQEIRFVPDAARKSIVVIGPGAQMEAVETFVASIESSFFDDAGAGVGRTRPDGQLISSGQHADYLCDE